MNPADELGEVLGKFAFAMRRTPLTLRQGVISTLHYRQSVSALQIEIHNPFCLQDLNGRLGKPHANNTSWRGLIIRSIQMILMVSGKFWIIERQAARRCGSIGC